MAFEKGNKLARFTGMKHKPESNAKRAETMKRLHAEGSVPGMGFKSPFKTDAARRRARLSAQLKHRYGISMDQYDDLVESQGNKCAICDEPPGQKRLFVDHDHRTGIVRGLLCSYCNTLIGLAGDNIEVLCEATLYLDRHKATPQRAVGVSKRRLLAEQAEDEARWKAYDMQEALEVHRG